MNAPSLQQLDYLVVAFYFALVFGIAAYMIWRDKKKDSQTKASSQYFLGGKNLGWFVIGASLFASNIGSEHLVGLAGAGAAGDFPAAQFEILAAFMLLLLGWLFVPFYLRSGVYTMPEFLEKRYNSWARAYLSWVSIIAYVLTKISVTIAAGGIIFTTLLGINFWTGAILVVVATGIYTVLGGLKAVVYTDMIQMFILLGGAGAVTYYGLEAVGGWQELSQRNAASSLSLWRSFRHESFPWTGIIFGAPILGVWYWCTDQFIVQRVLAARNIEQARRGTIFAGYLKMLPLFIFVLPGVIAMTLASGDQPLLSFPTEAGKPVYDAALPLITMQLLPTGLRGLVVAGLLAALMSSLSSVFNSCSTLFTIDIYQRRFPATSEKKLVRVGQITTALLVVLGLAWIPLLKVLEGGLFHKLQSIQAYISPPIAAVFLLGLFYKRINATGARYALITGALLGASRLLLELKPSLIPGPLQWFAEVNFLHFALLLFLCCCAILVGVSHLSSRPARQKTDGLTLDKIKNWQGSSSTNLILSFILILIIGLIWLQFR